MDFQKKNNLAKLYIPTYYFFIIHFTIPIKLDMNHCNNGGYLHTITTTTPAAADTLHYFIS